MCTQSRLNPTISSEGLSRQSPGISNCWIPRGTRSLATDRRILFIAETTAIEIRSTDVFSQNANVKVLQFHPLFDDERLHKVGLQFSIITSVTSAATSLFSTISSQPQTWTSPHCLLFMEREAVWVTAEAVYQSQWSWMTEMRWDGWTSKPAFGVMHSAFPLSLFLSLCLLALEHK